MARSYSTKSITSTVNQKTAKVLPQKQKVNKRLFVIIASVIAFIVLGGLSAVVYYYVTYGELPVLEASSAGFISRSPNSALPSSCRVRILSGVSATTVKKEVSTKLCPKGQNWDEDTCRCTGVCNAKIKCKTGMTLDKNTCGCVCDGTRDCGPNATFDRASCQCISKNNNLVTCIKPVKVCTIHYDNDTSKCIKDKNGSVVCPELPSGGVSANYIPESVYVVEDQTFVTLGNEEINFIGGSIKCSKSTNPPTVRLHRSETGRIDKLKAAGWECNPLSVQAD